MNEEANYSVREKREESRRRFRVRTWLAGVGLRQGYNFQSAAS
jgi:hypothetical protein